MFCSPGGGCNSASRATGSVPPASAARAFRALGALDLYALRALELDALGPLDLHPLSAGEFRPPGPFGTPAPAAAFPLDAAIGLAVLTAVGLAVFPTLTDIFLALPGITPGEISEALHHVLHQTFVGTELDPHPVALGVDTLQAYALEP